MPYKDKAKRNEVKKRWIESNKEKQKQYYKNYYEKSKLENPDIKASRARARRALIAGNIVIKYSINEVIEKYGILCYLCNSEINLQAEKRVGRPGWELGLHIDHYIDIACGGSDTLENVRPTHGLCNLRKEARSE